MVIPVAAALPAPNSDGEKIATPAIIASQQILRANTFDRFILRTSLLPRIKPNGLARSVFINTDYLDVVALRLSSLFRAGGSACMLMLGVSSRLVKTGVSGVICRELFGNKFVTFHRLARRNGALNSPISSRRSIWEPGWIEQRRLEKHRRPTLSKVARTINFRRRKSLSRNSAKSATKGKAGPIRY